MSERNLQILGWIGTCLPVVIYFSYIPQIMCNLDGNKTPLVHPLAAALNCTIWTSYGLLKAKKLSTFCCKLPRHNLWTFGNYNSVLMR